MRLNQIQRTYLYEGLDRSESQTMMLWENAGIKLREAALTADQIQQLFAQIEKSATAAGGNRTLLGKGKDAVAAVNNAWEDLKTKMQDSGPVKGFDQKVSDALSKIGMGAADPEFNGQVNKWVQKYRDFAKKHPIAQGAIYATLIALAGITGAGVAGATALGLLKLADQLLQGKRFSSAAYAGVKAGAMAFAASKLGDYIKGLKQGDQVPPAEMGELPPGAPKMDFEKYDYYVGDSNNVVAVPKGSPNPFTDAGGSTAGNTGSGIVARMDDNPLASPQLKKLAAKIADGNMLSDKEMSILDQMEIRSVKMSDMLNAPGSSGVGRAGAELTTNAGEILSGDAAAQAANTNFGAIQDLKRAAIELQGKVKYGDAASAASDAVGAAADKVASAATNAPMGAAMDPEYLQRVVDAAGKSGVRFKLGPEEAQAALDWQQQNGGPLRRAVDTLQPSMGRTGFSKEYLQQVISGEHSRPMISKERAAELLKNMESVKKTGRRLSEGQVYMIFDRVCRKNHALIAEGILQEGPLDAIKGAAGKALGYLQTKGKNLTTKVTADKLNSAWQKAGSPTDSDELSKFLQSQGVNQTVIDQVYGDLKIGSGTSEPESTPATSMDVEKVKAMVMKLPTDRKVRLLVYMTKQLKVA